MRASRDVPSITPPSRGLKRCELAGQQNPASPPGATNSLDSVGQPLDMMPIAEAPPPLIVVEPDGE